MELDFEVMQQVAVGSQGDVIHFYDTALELFYLNQGRIMSKFSSAPGGEWTDRIFSAPKTISPDLNVTNFRVETIPRVGSYGSWWSDNRHRYAIYAAEIDVSEYVESGSILYDLNNPVSSANLVLQNADYPLMDEENGTISPGAEIDFTFSAGDSESLDMGVLFADRSNLKVKDATISVDARNTIGKYLKDQTFDEYGVFPYQGLTDLLTLLLVRNGTIDPAKVHIYASADSMGITFPPDESLLDGINEILDGIGLTWEITEGLDGSIVLGPVAYEFQPVPGTYIFHRGSDIWSREIVRDDAATYSKVCVHDSTFVVSYYVYINVVTGWQAPSNKTLYVAVADGTTVDDAHTLADAIANQIAITGIVETFVGPIRPQLQPGDMAEIITDDGTKSLGLVTMVKHTFGKAGFYTEFSVDSGGLQRRGRLADYISALTKSKSSGKGVRIYS